MRNNLTQTKFILWGLTNDPELQVVIFLFLFFTYILSVTGNLTITILTLLDSHLETPMYFFLQNFSFLEISFTTVCIPRFLVSLVTKDRTISYMNCMAQLFFFIFLRVTEFYLLAAMSYDSYVAICKPLHYTTIMSNSVCYQLVFSSWVTGFLIIFPPLILALKLEFRASSISDHFICDSSPLLRSCSDTHFLELMSFFLAVVTLMVTLMLVILSYGYIIKTILKFPSAQQRTKAFPTCSSHMIVVSISYSSCIFTSIKPSANDRVTSSKGVAVLNTSVASLIEPSLYTPRNQQVKQAFKDMVQKVLFVELHLIWHKAVMRNHKAITTFILLGLTHDPKLQVLLFVFLFLTYLLSVAGNLIIITLTLLGSHLKTPMCYFLQNFSFLEVSFTTVCIPRFLYTMITGDNTVTYNACATQLFFVFLFGARFFLLAAMSYDHYMAICKPLHYMTIMNNRVFTTLVLCCWFAGLLVILPPLGMGLQLEFCDSNVIDHFGCDASPVLQITCSDTVLIERIVLSSAVLTLIITLVCVVLSYTYIIKTILIFPLPNKGEKAFSTCSFHIIVVSITCGSYIFIYIKPSAKEGVAINKVVSVLTTSVAPLLNPFIYTLCNKQVKDAFKDTVKWIVFLTKKRQLMFLEVIKLNVNLTRERNS
ncbi:LOW QUALITY PROTEIN: uncharacterized protein V5649_006047 [Rhynchonycteris naso]